MGYGAPWWGHEVPHKDKGCLTAGPPRVQAPSGVQVLMSATRSTYVEEEGVYHFHMEHPVPAYLVALVAGDLQPADIGPRYSPACSFLQPLRLPGAQGHPATGWLGPAQTLPCSAWGYPRLASLTPHAAAGTSPGPPAPSRVVPSCSLAGQCLTPPQPTQGPSPWRRRNRQPLSVGSAAG